MAKQDDWVRVTVRFPPDLHAKLLAKVASGPNSLNAEIISRLKSSVESNEFEISRELIQGASKETLDKMLYHMDELHALKVKEIQRIFEEHVKRNQSENSI